VWLINDIDDVGRVVVMCCCSPGRIVGEGTELNGPTGLPTPHTQDRVNNVEVVGCCSSINKIYCALIKTDGMYTKKNIFAAVS